jgi:hypothetical protein
MKLRTYFAAALLLVVAGCATAPTPPKPPVPAAARRLPEVLAKFERRLADGRLFIAANLKNPSTAAEQAKVECAFTDGDGRPVLPEPAALSVSLEPGEVLTVHFEAASIAAYGGLISIHP